MPFSSVDLADALGGSARATELANSRSGIEVAARIEQLISEEVSKSVEERTDVKHMARSGPAENDNR